MSTWPTPEQQLREILAALGCGAEDFSEEAFAEGAHLLAGFQLHAFERGMDDAKASQRMVTYFCQCGQRMSAPSTSEDDES